MARQANRLTDVVVKRLLGRMKPGMHPDGANLYLRIRPGTAPAWTLRWSRNGHDKWLPLGDARDMSLADARKKARAERAKVDAGRDPVAERRAARDEDRKRGTFRELAEDWYESEVAGKLKHPNVVRSALDNYLLPKLGRLPAMEVQPNDCARVLDDVRETYPTTANDLLRHLRSIFGYGIRRHRVTGSPVAAFTTKLDAGGHELARDRALSKVELGKLFAAIRKEPTFGGDNLLITRLLLALCARKGELLAAPWSEFDLDGTTDDGAVWHLPATRSKTRKALDIPLAPAVVRWLGTAQELAAGSKWVFPARRRDKRGRYEHVGLDTINVALGRVKHELDPFTVHDLRRTARTLLAELGVAPNVAELCLNHKPKGVEGIYNRHSYFAERRDALTSLADLLVQVEAGNTKVVPIRGRKKANS